VIPGRGSHSRLKAHLSLRGSAEKRIDAARSPELEARRSRYSTELGVGDTEAEILTRQPGLADLFEAALGGGAPARSVANWIVHELPREAGESAIEELPISGESLGKLVALVERDTISSSAGREVLAELVRSGGDPEVIVRRRGLTQVSDVEALIPAVRDVIAANAAKADEYRGGRTGLLGFFVGQVMKRTSGRANPEVVKGLIEEELRPQPRT
jgi:Asp-tRNA(Asn)/Glu-tRNA(Gln) amidotransferase B subunit